MIMTPEEEWAEIDKESIRFMKKDARESVCPKHVWVEGKYYSSRCIICGLHRRKMPSQYRYKYSKAAKHRRVDVNKRWEMYNQGIDLVEYDEVQTKKILAKYG